VTISATEKLSLYLSGKNYSVEYKQKV